MYRLVYVSTAAETLTDKDIGDIVATAQRINAERDITGLLLFNGLNFMQILEGPRKNVDDVFARISVDPRHISVVAILQEPMGARVFHNWAMIYKYVLASANGTEMKPDDLSDVLGLEMPEHIRRLIDNFDTLKGF